MRELIPRALYDLATHFYHNGELLYIVGGAVRNALMGLPIYDIDIASACPPEKVCELLKCYPSATLNTQNSRFGTLFISLNDSPAKPIEYTTFRSDSYVRGHKPSAVHFTDSIEKDALRRDFTVGAVYYDVISDSYIDPTGGIADIKARKLRTVLPDPMDVLKYDGLRLMRLVRLCGQLRFTPVPNLYEAALSQAHLLDDISVERLLTEMDLILMCDTAYPELEHKSELSSRATLARALEQLHEFSVLRRLSGNVSQSARSLCALTPPRRVLRWTALLSEQTPEQADAVLSQIRMDNSSKKNICSLLYWIRECANFSADIVGNVDCRVYWRRIVVDMGRDIAAFFSEFPCEWSGYVQDTFADMERLRVPFSPDGLAINGETLSKLLNIPPSRELGVIKRHLFDHVVAHPEDNTPERLRDLINKMIKNCEREVL